MLNYGLFSRVHVTKTEKKVKKKDGSDKKSEEKEKTDEKKPEEKKETKTPKDTKPPNSPKAKKVGHNLYPVARFISFLISLDPLC